MYQGIFERDEIKKCYKSDRSFSFGILGAIEHKTFWNKKKRIPKGIRLTGNNLRDILVYGVSPERYIVSETGDLNPGTILGNDSYAVYIDELGDVNECNKCKKIIVEKHNDRQCICNNCMKL